MFKNSLDLKRIVDSYAGLVFATDRYLCKNDLLFRRGSIPANGLPSPYLVHLD